MGLKKIRSEGGTGGKRGHSNMEHWAYTDEIKDAARSRRRLDDKQVVREQTPTTTAKKRVPNHACYERPHDRRAAPRVCCRTQGLAPSHGPS
jgi:hypothetical protein